MRPFVCFDCHLSAVSAPLSIALSSSAISRLSIPRRPLMNFRGAQSAPIQSHQFQPLSDGEIAQRHRNLPQLGSGAGGGGGRGLSSGIGDSRWNLEQQEEQGALRCAGEQRWGGRRTWRNDESDGWEDAPSSRGDAATGRVGGAGGWWGRRGEGRVTSRARGGGRGGWRHHAKSHDWERQPRNGNSGHDGRFTLPRQDGIRHWCYAENELPAAPHEKFVLVSYNILADRNAFEHYNGLYYHIPHWLMSWDRRRTKLVEELGLLSPDIMCLQEVDKYEELQEDFQRLGYHGAYKGRTGGALDGCAMFWKTTRFKLLEERSIQFNELNLWDNVAQLCVFQSITGTAEQDLNSECQQPTPGHMRGPGSLIIVGNIHVLFNPKRGDLKLGQVRVLLESAHALSEKYGGAPVAVAGDFNSTPNSDLYKFLATSMLDVSCLNRTTMSGQVESGEGAPVAWMSQMGQGSSSDSPRVDSPTKLVKRWHWTPEELLAATGTSDCAELRHNLNLRSAYSQIKGEDGCRDDQGEPLVTTFHRKFMGTVDYIWHTEGIDTVRVLDTVPLTVLQRSGGLPSRKWGSDHLALACELAFLPSLEPNLS